MYNGIGLTTARGSGTNGHVQRNWAFVRPGKKDNSTYKTEEDIAKLDSAINKQPNQGILDHQRKRKIEVKCAEFEELLEKQGYSDDEVAAKVETYRNKLLNEGQKDQKKDEFGRVAVRETHQVAEAQQEKNARLREAFGISEYFVEGSSFDPERKVKEELAKTIALQQELDAQKELDRINSTLGKKYGLVRTPSPTPKKVSAKDKKKKKRKNRDSSTSPDDRKKEKKKKSKKSKKSKKKKSKKETVRKLNSDTSDSDSDSSEDDLDDRTSASDSEPAPKSSRKGKKSKKEKKKKSKKKKSSDKKKLRDSSSDVKRKSPAREGFDDLVLEALPSHSRENGQKMYGKPSVTNARRSRSRSPVVGRERKERKRSGGSYSASPKRLRRSPTFEERDKTIDLRRDQNRRKSPERRLLQASPRRVNRDSFDNGLKRRERPQDSRRPVEELARQRSPRNRSRSPRIRTRSPKSQSRSRNTRSLARRENRSRSKQRDRSASFKRRSRSPISRNQSRSVQKRRSNDRNRSPKIQQETRRRSPPARKRSPESPEMRSNRREQRRSTTPERRNQSKESNRKRGNLKERKRTRSPTPERRNVSKESNRRRGSSRERRRTRSPTPERRNRSKENNRRRLSREIRRSRTPSPPRNRGSSRTITQTRNDDRSRRRDSPVRKRSASIPKRSPKKSVTPPVKEKSHEASKNRVIDRSKSKSPVVGRKRSSSRDIKTNKPLVQLHALASDDRDENDSNEEVKKDDGRYDEFMAKDAVEEKELNILKALKSGLAAKAKEKIEKKRTSIDKPVTNRLQEIESVAEKTKETTKGMSVEFERKSSGSSSSSSSSSSSGSDSEEEVQKKNKPAKEEPKTSKSVIKPFKISDRVSPVNRKEIAEKLGPIVGHKDAPRVDDKVCKMPTVVQPADVESTSKTIATEKPTDVVRKSRSKSRSSHGYSSSSSSSSSRSRSRSSASDSHSSRSRSSSQSSSASSRRSNSRSSDRSRSPSIPRRRGSPSFLDRRRITSARKRPIPYHRPTPSSASSTSSYSRDSTPLNAAGNGQSPSSRSYSPI